MHLIVLCVSFVAIVCGTNGHNHDVERGVHLGDQSLIINPEGIQCPVWAVSYNALFLDCSLNTNGLDFMIGNSKLRAGYENGRLYLKLGQMSSIPETNDYTLMVKRGNDLAGSLKISPKMLPKPAVIPELSRKSYGVRSGNVTILNAKTIYLPDFSYNGKAPDAFFWVGKGTPNDNGIILMDENGSKNKLGAYNNKHVMLKLPDGVTIEDIDYLSIWCREYTINFGSVQIPDEIIVPPPTYMPMVADYSKIQAITAIDGTEMLKFDGMSDNGKASLEFSVYFILLPALLILYK